MSRYTYSYRLGEKICNRIYSDSTLSMFISEISAEDSVAFQNECNSIKKKKDKNAGFILNRGYFSRENIRYMDKCGYGFVIMVKGMKSFVNDAIRQVQGTFEYVWLKMQDVIIKRQKSMK